MGILSRFADIMSANINALLANVEEKQADKLLNKYISDAKSTLSQVKAETAAVVAAEREAKRKLDDNTEQHAKYHRYATKSVENGNDTDARKFLTFCSELEEKKVDLEKTYTIAKENAEKMESMTKKLTTDIEDALTRLETLKNKLSVAEGQSGSSGGHKALEKLDGVAAELQKRADIADAHAELSKSPDDELAELAKKYETTTATDSQIEDRLAQMKAEADKK